MQDSFRAVMLLSDGFGGFGGIAKFNRDFLNALDASKHVEHVHALPRTIPDPIDGAIPESIVYDRRAAAGKVSYVIRLIRYLLRSDRIDVVLCGHRNLLPAAWLLARLRGAYLVLIVHGVEAWEPSPSAVRNWLAGRIDALVSVSRLTAERFCRWANVPMERVFILPNCVDLERFRPQPRNAALVKKHALQSSRVILTLGRLTAIERYKGFDEIIELMPRLLRDYPDLKYMIIGDGPDRERLAAKANALALAGKVIFTGRIAETDKVAYYNLADVYAMPSYGEGFGIVLIEAAACGVPVIGSNKDGSRETLLDGKLGRLVDPADSGALFRAIAEALAQGRHGERLVQVEMFSGDNFVRRVALWAEQVCQAVHGKPRQALGRSR